MRIVAARVLVSLTVVVVIAACRKHEGHRETSQPCVVGVVLPVSGQHAKLGELVRRGVETADSVLSIERKPHEPVIRFVYADTEGDGNRARVKFVELVTTHHASGVVGSILTSDTQGFLPELERFRVPVLANGSSAPELRGASRYLLRNWPADDYEGTVMAAFARDRAGVRRVVVMHADDPYPRGISDAFAREFKRLGGDVVDVVVYSEGAVDFEAPIRRLRAHSPDAIYIAGFPGEVGRAVATTRRLSPKLPILSAVAIDAPEFFEIARDAADDIFYTAPALDETSVSYLRFKEEYTSRFHESPEIVGAITYDAALLMGRAARAAGCQPDGTLERVRSVRDFPGASGVTSFEPNGDVLKPVAIKRIEDRRTFTIEDISVARR